MSNVCSNRIEITGNIETLKTLYDFVDYPNLPHIEEIRLFTKKIDMCMYGDKLTAYFDTAWLPAIEVVAKLSEIFPTLNILYRYAEPGNDFSGYKIIGNGKIIKEEEGGYHDFPVYEEDEEDEGEDVGG